jgi:hypothetical protein
MATARQLNVQMKDRTCVERLCRELADQGVSILALRSYSSERQSEVRVIADDPTTAKIALYAAGWAYKEAEVVQVALPHRPGEHAQTARAIAILASRLGNANIDINYAYFGVDPDLDQAGAAARGA